MNRSPVILLSVLTLCTGIFAASYFAARHVSMTCEGSATDDLSWLRTEFHLSDSEMARIQKLHEGYLPKCAEMCAQINAEKKEVSDALGNNTNVTAEAQQKLKELGELRAKCQAQMLAHFKEVSNEMPPAQGQRYLAEMQKITLGLHDDVEQSMSREMHGHN